MEISDNLLCVFSAQVSEQDGSYVIEIPKHEIANGDLEPGTVYRTALLATGTPTDTEDSTIATESETEEDVGAAQTAEPSTPPVQTGEIREVEIENIGDQGDGIARVERGYVIIVPGTDRGDQVTIEITTVRENVAFGNVVE